MFRQLLIIAAIFASTAACAGDYHASKIGVVVNVEPVYEIIYTPKIQEKCFQALVPVYGHVQSGNAFLGAIVGGVIGNQLGTNSNRDALTVLGAIVGANEASRGSRVIIGHTKEWRCEMIKSTQETKFLRHYQITYVLNGRHYRVNVDNLFEVGQQIVIQ